MRLRHLFTTLFIIASCAAPCRGQMEGSNDSLWVFQITGIVADTDSNQVLARIHVTLIDMGTPAGSALTNDEGQFTFSGIHNGRYQIQIRADGYEPLDQDVVVNRGSVNLYLYLKKSTSEAPAPAGPSVSVHELGVPSKAEKEFDKALALMNGKPDYHGAISGFDRAIQDYPDYYEAYSMEGAAYMALDDMASAERVLRKSIDLSSGKFADPLYLLAGLLDDTKRYSDAESAAREAIAIDGSSWRGYFELARALVGLGNMDEALVSATKSRDLKPDYPRTYLLLANLHTAQQDYPALLHDLDGYLALNPTGPEAEQARREKAQLQQALMNAQPAAQPAAQTAP
jgi:Tfp pilus assembly protein PilF